MKPLRTLLLAAGLGTRLRPITLEKPKCLISINGKPLLEHWLRRLEGIDCEATLINKHYLAEQVDLFIDKREKRSRAFLSIQDGCDFRCTFCIIPFARGKSRSMETSSVIDKINEFSNLGYNEVVLSGIHLSSYGNDIDSNLLELLKLIETYCQITNIRLSSIDPADTSKELIDFFSNSKKICPSFHIS